MEDRLLLPLAAKLAAWNAVKNATKPPCPADRVRSPMPSTPKKIALRDRALAARAALSHDQRRSLTDRVSERAFERIEHVAGIVGLYVPVRDEIQPRFLIDRLTEAGRRLALPCTPSLKLPLVFRIWAPGDMLVRGRMNIPEPSPDAPEVFPQVLIVPPVAFDRRCYRIGYGAGFYDRTIPILRHMHSVFTLGFAFSCQEVDRVPDEQHDVPLDAVATDAELIVPEAL
jgi:5-formyltetrahydrofolate cyclo-ligase